MLACFQHMHGIDISTRHIHFLRNHFRPSFSVPQSAQRIFISRLDATSRRLTNEQAIYEMLRSKFGFEQVILTGTSIQFQAQLFSQAEIIIGPHGAGMNNVTFANPQATLIELFSPNHIGTRFHKISDSLNVRYGYIMGVAVGESRHSDYYISPDKVKELVMSLC